ncbi:MAG TPA: Lrp/AsnC family transcriptional regulator, partial [Candidatus Methanofastidiosa archaeon]|nr:Lrp/AsnC family transcriptional regulator [Candidatus Methanofastidiosa archaeon]
SVDYDALGYHLSVMISLKIKRGMYPKLAEELSNEKEVITIYDVTGEFDGVLICVFAYRQELDKFLKKLQSHPLVEDTHTVLVLNKNKESHLSFL